MRTLLRLGVGVAVLAIAAGCGRVLPRLDEVVPDKRTEYRKADSLPDLEVPPPLSTEPIEDRLPIPEATGDSVSYRTYQQRVAERQRRRRAEGLGGDALKKLEDETLLVVAAAPAQLWPRLEAFFAGRGMDLELDDAELGVMETAWQENREELVREKFKLFLEPAEKPDHTAIYVASVRESLEPRGDQMVWRPAPVDAASRESLAQALGASLGVLPGGGPVLATAPAGPLAPGSPPVTSAPPAAQPPAAAPARPASPAVAAPVPAELVSVGGGKLYLRIAQDFAQAWPRTRSALERAGVPIEDADRSRGVFTIRAPAGEGARKKGVFRRLAFWKDDQEPTWQLSLTGVGDSTEVVVLDADGRWDASEEAGTLLRRLLAELGGT